MTDASLPPRGSASVLDQTGDEIAPAVRPLPASARPRQTRTLRTVVALMLREMQTTYGRSPGGYAWALLEPIGGIALFTLVISAGFRVRNPSLGENFPLFFATGVLVLSMTLTLANKIAASIDFSRPLLQYPGVKFTDALIARFILNLMTQLLVFFIIIVGIHLVFDVSTIWRMHWIVAGLCLTALLGAGLGVLNCFLFGVWALWRSIWAILTRPLFLVSTVFYIYEDIPREWQPVGWYNPLVHIIGLFRRGVYAGYDASWISITYVAAIGSVTLVLGLVFLHRFHREMVNR